MILAWIANDRPSFESSLGPHAKAALNSLLSGRTWEGLRAEIRGGKPAAETAETAVGYRFTIPGSWAQPWLQIEKGGEPKAAARSEPNPALNTIFKNRSGADCGERLVAFSGVAVAPGARWKNVMMRYLVDNSDLEGLLRLVDSCGQ